MDVTDCISSSDIRARIFSCKFRIKDLLEKRKKYHANIRGAKRLSKNISRCIDKDVDCELRNFELSSVSHFLSFLREALLELDDLYNSEVEYCAKLHRKMDELNERVYI